MIVSTPARFSEEIDLPGQNIGPDNPLETTSPGSSTHANSNSSPSNGDSLTNRRPINEQYTSMSMSAIYEEQHYWNRLLFGGWANNQRIENNNLRNSFSLGNLNVHEGGVNDRSQVRSSGTEPTPDVNSPQQSRDYHNFRPENSYRRASSSRTLSSSFNETIGMNRGCKTIAFHYIRCTSHQYHLFSQIGTSLRESFNPQIAPVSRSPMLTHQEANTAKAGMNRVCDNSDK